MAHTQRESEKECFIALKNPCLTGKISKEILKCCPSPRLATLGGRAEVSISVVEDADVMMIRGAKVAFGTATGVRRD